MIDGAGIVGVVVAAPDDLETVGDGTVLGEAAPDREGDARCEQGEEHRVVPQERVHRGQHVVQLFHRYPFTGGSGPARRYSFQAREGGSCRLGRGALAGVFDTTGPCWPVMM